MSDFEIPEGRVAVQRIGAACYMPTDGVVVETGELWHLPAAEAEEQINHPFAVWGPAPSGKAAKLARPVRDDPGKQDESAANAQGTPTV